MRVLLAPRAGGPSQAIRIVKENFNFLFAGMSEEGLYRFVHFYLVEVV